MNTSRIMTTLAILTLTAATAFGQYSPDNYRPGDSLSRKGTAAWSGSDDFRAYDRSENFGPSTASSADDFPELPASRSDLSRLRTLPSRTNRTRISATGEFDENSGQQIRYRIPLDRSPNRQLEDPFSVRDRNRFGSGDRNELFDEPTDQLYVKPGSRERYLDETDGAVDGRDPFVPAPLPKSRSNSESLSINELITLRYQNPVNVRAIRAMSSSQALQLFAEVSQKIDERSLEPTSYDLRVRRALRNLSLALDNPAFVNGLGLSADSFRMDSFRNSLARAAEGTSVRNYQEARSVLNSVMQAAANVQGLTPSVVAFEFSNASIDTLDKFSGLEAADPASRNGAQVEGVQSAALEEEIVGVGVEVREHADGLLVVKALRGGPAAEAGIESGDVILSISNRPIAGMTLANSVDLMKGTAGSQMKIRIYRDGKGERDFVLTRRTVRVWTVNDTRILSGTDIGYFSLSRFSQSSTAELDQALNSLHSKGMKSLIIDLRGNPGGLLTTCVEISDRFLACGTIVATKGRLNSDNMVETASYSKTWSVPLVVLIDGDSASASEIFAAAIQENERGLVVGTQSYGKGSVQTHFPLTAIGGDLRLTTALFYSPNGRKMAGEGVTPDVEIHDRDGVANGDEVLVEAVRLARSQGLKDMAKAAGTCRTNSPSVARSSSLGSFSDPLHLGTAVR
jgi:carboxyl-terminal processing protease